MDRHATLILMLAAGVAFARPAPPKKHTSPALHVRSIDLLRRVVMVELSGIKKAPAANLYRFTDVRGRHYVAMTTTCDPPFPSGARTCELEIPEGYERHRLEHLQLHLGGLHSRMIEADDREVASAWAAAEAARKEPQPSPSPLPLVHPAAASRAHPAPAPRAAHPSPKPSPRPTK